MLFAGSLGCLLAALALDDCAVAGCLLCFACCGVVTALCSLFDVLILLIVLCYYDRLKSCGLLRLSLYFA